MNKLIALYRKAATNLGKLLSTAGLSLVTLDLTGQADMLKSYAREAFGHKGVSVIAGVLFASLLIRTWWTGKVGEQLKRSGEGTP